MLPLRWPCTQERRTQALISTQLCSPGQLLLVRDFLSISHSASSARDCLGPSLSKQTSNAEDPAVVVCQRA
jgi:hypothetical protein